MTLSPLRWFLERVRRQSASLQPPIDRSLPEAAYASRWRGQASELCALRELRRDVEQLRAVLFTAKRGWELRVIHEPGSEVYAAYRCRTEAEVNRQVGIFDFLAAERGWR